MSIKNTSIEIHTNKGWNYEDELNDLHELIGIVEEIRGRMEDAGFEVYFAKIDFDPHTPNSGKIEGVYFDVLKCKKME